MDATTTQDTTGSQSLFDHDRTAAEVRGAVAAAVRAAGHATDDAVAAVDGRCVNLFVLPSPDYLYVGYGATGGRVAYRGPAGGLRPAAVAAAIIAHVSNLT